MAEETRPTPKPDGNSPPPGTGNMSSVPHDPDICVAVASALRSGSSSRRESQSPGPPARMRRMDSGDRRMDSGDRTENSIESLRERASMEQWQLRPEVRRR
jgi:hypothetical protein